MADLIQIVGTPFLACLIIGSILAYFGMHVLKREVIFIDIAVAQVAAVGSLVAHEFFHAEEDTLTSYLCSFAFVLLISAFYSVVRRRITQISIEAVIGISYAITTAGALFLIGLRPGHVHVQEMLAGNLLWVTWSQIIACLMVFSAVGIVIFFIRKPLSLISEDYEHAVDKGVNVSLWDFVFYTLVGIAITVAVRIAGVVVVFAFLIIPATTSALFSANWVVRMIIACVTCTVSSAAGLLFSYYLDDFSVGPPIALFLGGILLVAALAARFRRTTALTAEQVAENVSQ